MFKFLAALALLAPIVAFAFDDISPSDLAPGVEPLVRNYGAPKCYVLYKKCCAYKKPVHGKCHKKVCRQEKQCKQAYHAADGVAEAGVGEVIDAVVKNYYGYGKKQQHVVQKNHYVQKKHYVAPKQYCHYVDKRYNQEYDCIKNYDEGYHCENEKKRHGDY